jgi:hypothetical protein
MRPSEDHNEERLRALLRTAETGAAPPDREFLDRLRQQSAAAFASSSIPEASSSLSPQKGRAMFSRIVGSIAVLALAVAGIWFGFFRIDKPVQAGPKFGEVMENVRNAKSLHGQITKDGKTSEVWSEKNGRWRADSGTGSYEITDGSLFWTVDEKSGKATRLTERPTADVFDLILGSKIAEKGGLEGLTPAEKVGDESFLYRMSLGKIDFEAVVDVKTKRLRSFSARNESKQLLGEFKLLEINTPLPEDKFLVLNSLSEDGRVGKVTDTQGIASVKPMAQSRWTPICNSLVLMPGDLLRTDVRGANAVEARLLSRANIIVGPGSEVELAQSTQIKLHSGEMEISVPKDSSVELDGPEDQKVVVKGTQHYRVDKKGKLLLVAKSPLWLQGFKGQTANESLGSLIAKVDGRNVPLSVGYHKVTVDIRDQIARTTIEESFVNHTDAATEGVFYFPLPQDASISGFGMWIGNELVMADVVEKQRAREIYEQIKRERRDPGLLEWQGGNIFSARVWPIPGNGEKRVKIVYTQVLPLRGNTYRYNYALQSEMLQQHPLKDLSLTVNVNSEIPLKKVWSPTHSTRDQFTPAAARVEFSAQEYTPNKDFEVVIEQEKRASDIVMIPHRRGDDGYFMLQLMPPAASTGRDVLPDSGPLHVLILADTSASMDKGQRQRQDAFLAALLGSLTPTDTFNLAACDVNCDWVFEQAQPATFANIQATRQMLEQRVSLGWTDLDKAFGSAMRQAGPNTHVIYIGDGIITTGDADPMAFTKRLKRMYEGKAGTFHAVTVGTSFESNVLKGIASLGGGSMRKVGGEQTPALVALDLLREMAQPTLRNIKVEFKGLQVARVYPEELPNVPAGTQQILLGRYLPQGNEQPGEVIVTGMLNGKEVRMEAKINLPRAEVAKIGVLDEASSFIPRLWARMHLDSLLEQGSSAAIRDEIIALSEEYQIITPYTSLLVLESDADRARFGVKRRFQMRDGEKFFADGRDNVDYALVQQQMKRAGLWRLNLRRDVLRSFAKLGRNPQQFQQEERRRELMKRLENEEGFLGEFEHFNQGPISTTSSSTPADLSVDFAWGRMGGVGGRGEVSESDSREMDLAERTKDAIQDETKQELKVDAKDSPPGSGPEGETRSPDAPAAGDSDTDELIGKDKKSNKESPLDGLRDAEQAAAEEPPSFETYARGGRMGGEYTYANGRYGYYYRGRRGYDDSQYWQQQWWQTLFPPLPKSAKPKEVKTNWPEEARKLAQSLLRTEKLQKLSGGLEISQRTETFDPRWKELTSRNSYLELWSPNNWLARTQSDNAQAVINWCDGKECGLIHQAFQIGRIRASVPQDLDMPSLDDYSITSLERTYFEYAPRIEPAGMNRMRLILTHDDSNAEVRFLIDTSKNVVLSVEKFYEGKLQVTTRYSDFLEVAGSWWAQTVETITDGERTSLSKLSIKALSAEEVGRRTSQELAGRDKVLLTKYPLPSVNAAKKAVANKKDTLEDHFALLRHFAASQQWTKVREELEFVEKLAAGKPGLRWYRDAVLFLSRRYEELKQRQLEFASQLAKEKLDAGDAMVLAQHLLGKSGNFMSGNEQLGLLDRLRPIYEQQPAHLHAMKGWKQSRAGWLASTGQQAEALRIYKELATDYPHDVNAQTNYAQQLFTKADYAAGYAWITEALARNNKWLEWEDENLRGMYVRYLETQGRYLDALKYLEEWMKKDPASTNSYAMYLATLVRLDQEAKANETIERWFKTALENENPTPADAARLTSAINLALGQGYNLYTNRIDQRWYGPLAKVVRHFARDPKNGQYADQIMNHGQFHQTDEARAIRYETAGILAADIGKLPLGRISSMVNWLIANDPVIADETWKRITVGVKERWQKETKPRLRVQWAGVLVMIFQQRGQTDELIGFLRQQLQEGTTEQKWQFALQLFDALLKQPWKAEYENEAFALLAQLKPQGESSSPAVQQIAALYRLTDRMVQARTDDLNNKIERPDKLTRKELREKQTANLRAAREGFADRLAHALLAKSVPPLSPELAKWMVIERLYLETVLERDSNRLAADAWEIVGNEPPKPLDADAEVPSGHALEQLRKDRAFATLSYLAGKPKADSELIDRLLKYVDKGIAQEGDASDWKRAKERLLIALDKPKDLEGDLRQWINIEDGANIWKLSLGYLLAEQGKLKEAVQLFEAIEKADELGPQAYRSLADWYMTLNQREKYEQATVASYKMTEEYRLSQRIAAKLYPWHRGDGHLPSELDKVVLFMFEALFEKSAAPQNYLYQLQQFYQACRDFRLLGTLADAVVGQTATKIYPFLQGMDVVIREIHDEATVDQMMKHLEKKARPRAKTPIDHRALDLLEVLVQRRAAELQNQPAPHGDKALAALGRAFDRQWADGEQPLMADLLAHLSKIAFEPLAKEQVRELEWLHQQQKPGTHDRLHVGHRLANIYFAYGRLNNSTDLLYASLKEYQDAHAGILPVDANEVIGTLVSYEESGMHHSRVEKFLLDQLQHPVHEQQKFWLVQTLYRVDLSALSMGGEVSLGKGQVLYKALEQALRKDLDTPESNHFTQLGNLLCSVYRTAKEKKLDGYVEDLHNFAFQHLPEILKKQINNYDWVVQTVAATVHDVISPKEAIAFVLDRIETEPSWFRLNNQDGWARNSYNLAWWRVEAKELGELEPRMLKVVLKELKLDLDTQTQRSRYLYHRDYGNYWPEKEAEFVKAANEVYAQRANSGATVKYIADYLYRGVNRPGRAIEVLIATHEKKLLDDPGQAQLVRYLQEQNRYAESIPLLLPLIERHPEDLSYRTQLMTAYHRTRQHEKLLATLKTADTYFHQQDRWNEGAMASLAYACLDCELFPQSVEYYKEVIGLRQRSAPGRGVGDSALADYYSNLARAYSRLGKTADAVDAAGGAIVAWSAAARERATYIERLREVLSAATDLDAFVAQLDQKEKERGQGSPIIRKALGRAYVTRDQFDKAIAQYRVAIELQPEDAESHRELIAVYDRIHNQQGAIDQLLASVQQSRRELALYQNLGDRYAASNQPKEAERAYTSIVEMLPREAESHSLFADVLQKQNRWKEAVPQFELAAQLNSMEPTALLGLARAQIHLKEWDKASETVKKLESHPWPARFPNAEQEIRALRVQIEQRR